MNELHVLTEMKAIAATLREMVTFLTEEKQSGNEAIKTILLVNHPIFRRLAALTRTQYRIFFSTWTEMGAWLKARNWEEIPPEFGGAEEWYNEKMGTLVFITKLFDEKGSLRIFSESDWNDDWIKLVKPPTKSKPLFDDDIPF